MWSRIWLSLKTNFPLIVLLIVLGVVTWINYPWGSSLLGWDSVQPELDFGINLRRALSSVWVGNQGVGHIGGHGYATILIQGVIEWVISLVVGLAQTRGVFIFSMLWLGPIGIYFLWKKWFKNIGKFARWGAMLSGLFYLLNLGTVQVFFAPLEAFTVFFGLLPWTILSIVNYLSGHSRKNLIWLLVIQIIFSMIGFIPPQFIAYGMMVLALLIGYMVEKRRDVVEGFKKLLTVVIILLMANLYWLAPVAYYSMHGANSYAEAKNNQVSTPDFQYMSEARGKWSDVALMRGFFIDSSDSVIKSEGKFFEIFEPWNNYLNGNVEIVGYGLFAVSMLGLFALLVRRGKRSLGLSMLLILGTGWVAIAQAEEPFTTVASLIRNIPVLGQAFRAAFTKFVGLLIFVYAIGFGYGIFVLYKLLRENLLIGAVLVSVGVGSLSFYMWPMFKGNLIYERMKVDMPSEYSQVMNFFQNQDKQSRIAYLPSAWMWGWQVHEWKYSGSGFLWYGIEQPILDRAFDVWSPYNEGFYGEFSNVLYGIQLTANGIQQERIDDVVRMLDKYDVRHVLLDESVIAPGQDSQILRVPETKAIMEEMGAELVFQENFLSVWDLGNSQITNSQIRKLESQFISAPGSYTWVEADTEKVRKDVVFEEVGHFVTSSKSVNPSSRESTLIYPFAGLMREEVGGEQGTVNIEYGVVGITLTSYFEETPPAFGVPTRDSLGSPDEESPLITIPGWKVGDIVRVDFENGEVLPAYKVNGTDGPRFLGEEKPDEGESYFLVRVSEGEEWNEYLGDKEFRIEGTRIEVDVAGEPHVYDFGMQGQGTIGNCDVLKRGEASKVSQSHSDTVTQYTADGRGAVCDYVVLDKPFTRLPYLMRIRGENVEGRSLKFFVWNTGSQRNDVEWLMSGSRKSVNPYSREFDQTFALLPWDWDGHYTLNIETRSFGQRAENRIEPVEVRYFPLEQIARARITNSNGETPPASGVPTRDSLESPVEESPRIQSDLEIKGVKKFGTWLYIVETENGGLLKLSQGYDVGWVSPYLEHVKVDGWANGWIVPGGVTIVIFYWPQLLQYLGFVLLGVTITVVVCNRKQS